MPHRLLALLGHDLLPWARNRSGMTLDQAAWQAGVSRETLAAWEDGRSTPDWRQLKRLAEIYRTSIGVFFLKEPPMDDRYGNNA